MKLRPYQEEAVQAVINSPKNGIQRPMVVLPTGMGKTVVFTSIAREMNTRTLVIAHREELLTQAKDKFRSVWPGVTTGIVQGRKNEYGAKVVVGSVQTLINQKRIDQLGNNFGLIIVDEAHHAAADSYRKVLQQLRAFEENGPLTVGVTATPNRADGIGLDGTFQEIVYQKDILYGIQNGYLCDLKGITCRLDVDYKKLKSSQGDIQASSSGRLLLAADAPKHTVEAYITHAAGRKGVVFTPTVEVAERIAEAFREAEIPAAAVSGDTPREERRKILRDLDTGEIQIVVNCGVLTEGFDQPDISCVIIARPTQSQALYIQMVGRGTRLHPDKKDCIVIDMVGASDRNDLITMPNLYGVKTGETITEAKERQEEEEEEQEQESKDDSKPLQIDGKLVSEVKDLFKRSNYNWGEYDGKYHLQYGNGTIWLVQKDVAGWHVFDRRKDGYVELLNVFKDLEEAMNWGEQHLRSLGGGALTLASKKAEWREEPATQKQIDFLRRNAVKFRPGLTKGQASRLIIQHKARVGSK